MPGANLKGAALGLASMLAYATHDAVLKLLGASYSPFQILFFAAVLSFPPVTVLLMSARGAQSWRPRFPAWVALRSLCISGGAIACTAAFAALPLAQVYAILFTMPLLITLMSIPLLGERVGLHRWGAILVGLAGVMIVLRPGTASLSMAHGAAMVGALGAATAAVIARRIAAQEKAVVLVIWPLVLNVVITALALPFVYRPMPLGDLGLSGLVAILSLVGGVLSVLAYRAGEAAVVAPMQYSQILWAALYGWLLFSETPDRATVLGVTVIIGSGLYILWRETRGGHSQATPVTAADAAGDALVSPRSTAGPRIFPPA